MVRCSTKGAKSESDIGGGNPPLPGRYHVVISSARELEAKAADKNPSLAVTFDVLAGTVPGQAGRSFTEFFPLTEKSAFRVDRLAFAAGVLRADEERDVDASEFEAKQLVVECHEDEYQGKKRIRLTMNGMWAVCNPEVKDVPKDQAVLRSLSGNGNGNGSGAGNGNGTSSSTTPPAKQEVPNDWAGVV